MKVTRLKIIILIITIPVFLNAYDFLSLDLNAGIGNTGRGKLYKINPSVNVVNNNMLYRISLVHNHTQNRRSRDFFEGNEIDILTDTGILLGIGQDFYTYSIVGLFGVSSVRFDTSLDTKHKLGIPVSFELNKKFNNKLSIGGFIFTNLSDELIYYAAGIHISLIIKIPHY